MFGSLVQTSSYKVVMCYCLYSPEKPSITSVTIVSALVPLALVLIAVAGFLVYKQKKGEREKQKDDVT